MFRGSSKLQKITAWFLVISYAIGSPAMITVEYLDNLVSQRFGLMPEFVYSVGVIQFACAFLLFSPRLAAWSLAVLSVLSLGAIGLHLNIGSPLTGMPALGYTVLQVWILVRLSRRPGGEVYE